MKANKIFRKMFSTLLFLALLAGAFAPSLVARAAAGDEGVVIASKLNLRKGPGFSYDVIKILENGQKLSVLEKSDDGLWLKVHLPDGKEGWVYAVYVQVGAAKPLNGFSLVDKLNLRVGPGTSYTVRDTLTKGQPLTVLGRSVYGEWLLVRTAENEQGWVFSPYVETDADINGLPVSEAYGGPTGSTGSSSPLNIVVTIRDNKAIVELKGFPENVSVVAKLSNSSQNTSVKVASGSTNSSGKATLSFEMPKNWPEGASTLKVSTEDGKFERTASILYYK